MNRFFRKKIFPLLLLLLSSGASIGQGTNNEAYGLNKVIPASPNAASLGKYGEIPVSLYTGIPSISIPIYEINEGRIKLPISLSYHAGGIKVEEIASWAGLGWSLSSGGSISRTVMGLPDEGNDAVYGSGYFNTLNDLRLKPLIDSPQSTLWWKNQIAYRLTKVKDAEPDIFTVSAGGFSGKFFYSQEEQRFFSVPASNLKISKIDDPNNGSFKFEITDENGLIYTFDVLETNRVFDYLPNITDREIDFPTSWFLSSIYDPVTKKSVTFSYINVPISYETMKSEVQYYGLSQAYFENNKNVNVNHISSVRLTNIYFGNGNHIDFVTSSTSRLDLTNDKSLQFVKVYNGTREIKRVELKHTYFQSDNIPDLSSDLPNIHSYAKRLKLDSLIEYDPETNLKISRHAFEYDPYTLPNRLSYAQDLWGYCNGQSNYPSLIPAQTIYSGENYVHLPGSNRNINSYASQACILKKIIYPTGGHTEFEYENNRIPYTGELYDKVQKIYSVSQDPQNPAQFLEMTLTINEPEAAAWVTFSVNFDMANYNAYQTAAPPYIITLVNTATNAQVFYYDNAIPYPVLIPNGTYTLKIDFSTNPYPYTYTESNIVCIWMGSPPIPTYTLVGGLRIKQIKNFDPVTNKEYNIQNFYYTREDNDTISSGRIRASAFPTQYTVDVTPVNTPLPSNSYLCMKRFQYSHYPLSSAAGGPAEYQSVTVITTGESSRIKKVTSFFGLEDYADESLSTHTGPSAFKPLTTYDHFRGFEKSIKEYAFTNNDFKLIKEKRFEYSNLNGQRTKFAYGLTGGWSVGYSNEPVEVVGESYIDVGYVPLMGIYKVISDKLTLSLTVEKSYTATGEKLIDSIIYDVNPRNFAVAQSKSYSSTGDTIIEKIKYPVDYIDNLTGTSGWLTGIVALNNANMNNTPIENARFIKKGSNLKLVRSFLTLYNNELLPGKIMSTDNNPLTNYAMSYSAGNSLTIDTRQQDKVAFLAYNTAGNLLTQQKANDVLSSYIWGYNDTYPIAQVINASVNSFAYTSFEANDLGGWTMSPGGTISNIGSITGNKAFSGVLNKTVPVGAYTVTMWSSWTANVLVNGIAGTPVRRIGLFELREWKLNNVTSIQVTADGVDEVRLHPQDAQMTTYTYDPLIGLTSQCDVNNHITYYEYDGLGRLKTIRDENKNVLKTLDYQFQKPYNQ